MNLKIRLEKLCDSRAWVRLHFADGTNITGRVLRVGQDYLEMESFVDPIKTSSATEYSKHLIPLSLVKLITIESSTFADSERTRLNFLSSLEASGETLPELEK
jgi:hypothetical protein